MHDLTLGQTILSQQRCRAVLLIYINCNARLTFVSLKSDLSILSSADRQSVDSLGLAPPLQGKSIISQPLHPSSRPSNQHLTHFLQHDSHRQMHGRQTEWLFQTQRRRARSSHENRCVRSRSTDSGVVRASTDTIGSLQLGTPKVFILLRNLTLCSI